jgi:kinesin family member 1
LEAIAGLDEFGDVADPVLASATQPSVGIKVIDKRHNALYVWSLDRLQQQIQRMRNLTTFIDRPAYSQHFSAEEPFYDSPPPEYSFIGNALVSLAPLSRRLSSTATVPIFCRYTAEAIGSCRVDLKIVNVVLPPSRSANASAASTRPSSPIPGTLPTGSKISFFLTVDSVKGLSSHDFSAAHMQVRLSSFVGPSRPTEEVYTSSALDMDKSILSELKFRRSFSLQVTSKMAMYLRTAYAPIEFFAKIKPTYLERMERWDEMREQRGFHLKPEANGTPSSESSLSVPLPPMRRSETDFVVEQLHDVVAWLQVCELASDGQYVPVPVLSQGLLDPGSFTLHQGLQRRVVLQLASNSGRQLPWTQIIRVKVGCVRLLDPKGRVHESTSKDLVDLTLLKDQTVDFPPDGTGTLSAVALWDSSVHDSPLLNRVTAANQRILLQLHWYVTADTCLDPIHFQMDLAVTMAARDARPPSKLMSLLGSSKILSKTSTVFSVRLTPPLTRSPKDLWRLDTSEKYVRGEEVLGTFKPRGISVVEDYSRLVSTEQRAADVQAIKVVLAAAPPPPPSDWLDSDEILRKSLGLWQKQFGHQGKACRHPISHFMNIDAGITDCSKSSPFRSRPSFSFEVQLH